MRFLSIFPFLGLLIMALLISFKIYNLKRKGISFRNGNPNLTFKKLLVYLFFLLILMFWLTALAGHTFNLHPFFQISILTRKLIASPVLTVVGALTVLLSVLIMGTTLVHFKKSLRFGLNKNNQGELITTGIFALSRNPFFLSLDIYFIGQAIIFPGIVFIGIALLAIIGIHFFILREEKFLLIHYGDLYINYRQNTGRYF